MPTPPPPYPTVVAAFVATLETAEDLAAYVRELVTAELGIRGWQRFRGLRQVDRAEVVLRWTREIARAAQQTTNQKDQ